MLSRSLQGGPDRAGDRGAAVSGFVLILGLAALTLVVALAFPLVVATANSDQAENSADAAALAGAERVRELALDRVGLLLPGQSLGDRMPASAGIAQASTYAQRNGADLSSYAVSFTRDRVDVEVYLRDAGEVHEGSGRTHRRARASVGVELAQCRLGTVSVLVEPTPTPTPTPAPTPDPSATPTPTPTPPPLVYRTDYQMRCPGFSSSWATDRHDALAQGRAWLADNLAPRLVR